MSGFSDAVRHLKRPVSDRSLPKPRDVAARAIETSADGAAAAAVKSTAQTALSQATKATEALTRVDARVGRAAHIARWASRAAFVIIVAWVLALFLAGWLPGLGGLIVLALVGALWLVAWFGTRNLAGALDTIGEGLSMLTAGANSALTNAQRPGALSDETIRLLTESLKQRRLSLGDTRSILSAVKGGTGSIAAVRSLSFATYAYGLASYAALLALCALGAIVALIGLIRIAT